MEWSRGWPSHRKHKALLRPGGAGPHAGQPDATGSPASSESGAAAAAPSPNDVNAVLPPGTAGESRPVPAPTGGCPGATAEPLFGCHNPADRYDHQFQHRQADRTRRQDRVERCAGKACGRQTRPLPAAIPFPAATPVPAAPPTPAAPAAAPAPGARPTATPTPFVQPIIVKPGIPPSPVARPSPPPPAFAAAIPQRPAPAASPEAAVAVAVRAAPPPQPARSQVGVGGRGLIDQDRPRRPDQEFRPPRRGRRPRGRRLSQAAGGWSEEGRLFRRDQRCREDPRPSR